MGSRRCAAGVAGAVFLLAPAVLGYGEPVDGFPSREERQVLVGINRVRANPDDQAAGNASACSTPHPPVPPVVYQLQLSHAARFHCRHLTLNGGGLSHATYCTLTAEIATNGCDGSAACSCVGGTECWSCTTLGGCGSGPQERASIFGFGGGVSEVGAANYGALGAAMGWATECPPQEGHRDALSNGGVNVVGTGYAEGGSCWGNYEFADFSSDGSVSIPRIPSAADGPGYIEANYYDAAGDPQTIDAVIDGVCVPMMPAVGLNPGNRDYRASFTPSACHEYYIVARDAAGVIARYPDTGSYTLGCPDEYIPTQADADCSACNAGEMRVCNVNGCDGMQGCESGVWGMCDAPATCGEGGAGGSSGGSGPGGSGAGSGASGPAGSGAGSADDGSADLEGEVSCSCDVPGGRAPGGLALAALALLLPLRRRRVSASPSC